MTSTCITNEKKEDSVLFHKYKEQIKIIQDKTGINGKYLIIGLLCGGMIVFLGIFEALITNLVTTLIPAYMSIKSIESLELDVDKQWITYWVIFSLLHFLDLISVLFIAYLPFYYFIKYLFLVWLFLPNFSGAAYLYDVFISNHFKKIEALIERKSPIKKRVSEIITEPIQNESIKLSEKIQQQPSTPSKATTEATNTSSEKKVHVPAKTAVDLLMEKKNI